VSNPESELETFGVRGDFITLGQLIKALGEARTGGDSKLVLLDGGLTVNGEPEMRRGRKLRVGDTLRFPDGRSVRMTEPTEDDYPAPRPPKPGAAATEAPAEAEPPKRRFKSKIAAKRAHKAETQRRREAAGEGHQQQGQQPGNRGGQVGADGRRGLAEGFSRRGRHRPR
jgi:ribosome-associated protein